MTVTVINTAFIMCCERALADQLCKQCMRTLYICESVTGAASLEQVSLFGLPFISIN